MNTYTLNQIGKAKPHDTVRVTVENPQSKTWSMFIDAIRASQEAEKK